MVFIYWGQQPVTTILGVKPFVGVLHGGIRSATCLPISVWSETWIFHVDYKIESLPPVLFRLTCHATIRTVLAN